jgi:serine/threonine-protein kinase
MDTDRNLLFGVLALQAGLIDNDQFARACTLWSAHKDMPLADVLVEHGWLSPEDQTLVDLLLQRKLQKHAGDVQASLAAVTHGESRRALAAVADPVVQQTLGHLPPANGPVLISTVAYQPESRQRYTLSRLHATGGIGQVWLARDTDLGRDVALKELRPERQDQPAIRARFVEEGRVTGQLEHPGIVPVYELARDAEGSRPFYTMRFIRGRTLQEAARSYHKKRADGQAGPLELRELLTAFVAVCNAVAYAHARGVIHRDLKPQNVILGDFGEAMVVDWGLAKVVGRAEDSSQLPVDVPDGGRGETVQGQLLGTPAYMAPEQAEGRLDQIDRLSDVYGLGAVLYEVLTGRPPFTAEDTQSLLRQVIHEAPPTPRQLVSAIPSALEAVCLKALAKRREERYGSASDLAREVERFLAEEPVAAYREPLPARLARWGRRHRTLLASAAALLVAAVLALGAGILLLGRANRLVQEQRDEAQRQEAVARRNFQRARQAVDTYLTEVSEEQLLNQPSMEPLRQRLLRSALEYYQAFVKERQDDPSVQRDLAEAYRRLGEISNELGDKKQARENLQKAIELFEGLRQTESEELTLQAGLARSYYTLAYAQAFDKQPAEGEVSAKRAIPLLEQLRAAQPGASEYGRMLGRAYDLIAQSRINTGKSSTAQPFADQAIAILRRTTQEAPTDIEAKRLLALASNNLSILCRRLGQPETQKAALQDAVTSYQEILKVDPQNPCRSNLALSLENVGRWHQEAGRFTACEVPLEEAYRILQKLTEESRQVARYKEWLGFAHLFLGIAKSSQGQTTAARRHLQEALAIHEAQNRDNYNDDRLETIGQEQFSLGCLEGECGEVGVGIERLQKARAMFQQLTGTYPEDPIFLSELLETRQHLVRLQAAGGQLPWTERVAEQKQIVERREQLRQREPHHPRWQLEAAASRVQLAELFVRAGEPKQALAALDPALQALEKLSQDSEHYAARHLRAEALAVRAQAQTSLKDPAGRDSAQQAVGVGDKLATDDPAYLYDLACYRALRSSLLDVKSKDADQTAAAAVEALSKAVAAGYDNVHKLKTDPRLDAVRQRAEFSNVLQQAQTKSKAGKE